MRFAVSSIAAFVCSFATLAISPPPPLPALPPGTPTASPAPRTSQALGAAIQKARALPTGPAQPQGPAALVWDSMSKEYQAASGELTAPFKFAVTNSSSHEVTINSVRTSCGCTVAKLPSTPWKLGPGEGGDVEATVDLRGKFGTLSKFVSVDTSEGPKMLNIKVVIPSTPAVGAMGNAAARARNMQTAIADRQAVFKNDCATCHVTPAIGKVGEPLYQAACGVCHEDAHRATMVPDLHALKTVPTRQYWEQWVTMGKPATLMPAFAQSEGGPLTPDQIHSLVDYLTDHFPQRAQATATAPH